MPPVGGNHAPVWQNCGVYLEPIPNETGVHSMEHGAVWITYGKDLPAAQVAQLQALGRAQTYLVVSPFDGLPSPLVLTAWGKQLRLTSADDARLDEFLTAYRQGPADARTGRWVHEWLRDPSMSAEQSALVGGRRFSHAWLGGGRSQGPGRDCQPEVDLLLISTSTLFGLSPWSVMRG